LVDAKAPIVIGDARPRTFLDPQVVARLAALPLSARQPMLGNVSGRHVSPNRGASVEFAEYRKYVPGDDLRRLDWRAFGRSDRYYVKEFEADTNLRCCFVLDTSGSMGYGSTPLTKIEYARRIAATLAYLAVQQGDAVGLACVAEAVVQTVPPRRNAAHLRTICDLLEKASPAGPTQLPAILHELAETIPQRALIVVISDFFFDPTELRSSFEHLRFRKHDVTAFHLLDPQELNFKFQRPMRFLDMEGGPAIFADPQEILSQYLDALQTYLTQLQQCVLETAVDYHRVSLDQDYEQVLSRFLLGRARGKNV
jgi:uncharacterized protein (DUF58 family)